MENNEIWQVILRYRELPFDEQMEIHHAYYSDMYNGTYPTNMEKVARRVTFEEANKEDEVADMKFATWLKKYFNEY